MLLLKEAKEAVLYMYFVQDFQVNFWQLNVLIYLYYSTTVRISRT